MVGVLSMCGALGLLIGVYGFEQECEVSVLDVVSATWCDPAYASRFRAMMVLGGIMTVSSAVLINYELGDGGEEEYANVI